MISENCGKHSIWLISEVFLFLWVGFEVGYMKHLAFQVLVKDTPPLEGKLIYSLVKVIPSGGTARQYWMEVLQESCRTNLHESNVEF